MIQGWKTQHIIKGLLTYLPVANNWRRRRGATGGSDSARYCYSVWLRHLSVLAEYGFRVRGIRVGELGPGDSIGTGIAALISGAKSYVGLDVVPFSAKADLGVIYEELVEYYLHLDPIPGDEEFPHVRPKLASYAFPQHLVDCGSLVNWTSQLRLDIAADPRMGARISYQAPWNSPEIIAQESLDLIFSQAVLEHVDALVDTYLAMYAWLKKGGFASHVIDFGAHHLSPFWNGHWAYDDLEWRLVRGRREWLLNREPISTHLDCAKRAGFEILRVALDSDGSGLSRDCLTHRYQQLADEDLRTRGAVLLLRKRG